MANARALYPKQSFRVLMDVREVLVLLPGLADEIRNDPNMDFFLCPSQVLLQSSELSFLNMIAPGLARGHTRNLNSRA